MRHDDVRPGRIFYTFAFVAVLFWAGAVYAQTQTTGFSYQGKLTDGGNPANANYDLQFALFDNSSGGTQIGSTLTRSSVAVSGGVFTVQLDFGVSAFPGANRFLEIGVRPNGGGSFTTLSPRQQISSTPYAIRTLSAQTADTATNATQLGGVAASQYVQTNDSRLTDSRPPTAGSSNYIQNNQNNPASTQSGSFNISGDGTAGATLSGNVVNAATQFNIGGSRVLSVSGGNVTANGVGAVVNSNTFGGVDAGASVIPSATTSAGNFNTLFGVKAGMNTAKVVAAAPFDGCCNSFFGNLVGLKNTTGHSNAFFGGAAGIGSTTGSFNAFFGDGAGSDFFNPNVERTGSLNTFIGFLSGGGVTTGSNNTSLGSNTTGAADISYATAIGANAVVNTSDTIVLGKVAGTYYGAPRSADTVQIPGDLNVSSNIGIGTTAPQSKLHMFGSSGVFTPFRGLTIDQTVNSGTNLSGYAMKVTTTTNGGTGTNFLIDSVGNVGIGTVNPLARFHVSGGTAAFDGNVGIGTTSPTSKLEIAAQDGLKISGFQPFLTLTDSNAGNARGRIASGNGDLSFYPESSFASGAAAMTVKNGGNVGIGTTTPGLKLHIAGHTLSDWPIIKLENVDGGGHSYWLYSGAGGVAGNFGIYDETAADYILMFTSSGNISIGRGAGVASGVTGGIAIGTGVTVNNNDRIQIGGFTQTVQVGKLNLQLAGFGDSPLCRDNLGFVVTCGSSLRYKTEVHPFSGGLEIINRLRPISFTWKSDHTRSLGLGAEEVAAVEPLLVTHNDKGEIEGVKYAQLNVVLINAIKQHQAQIEQQQRLINLQETRLSQQQHQISSLKQLLCLNHKRAVVCK